MSPTHRSACDGAAGQAVGAAQIAELMTLGRVCWSQTRGRMGNSWDSNQSAVAGSTISAEAVVVQDRRGGTGSRDGRRARLGNSCAQYHSLIACWSRLSCSMHGSTESKVCSLFSRSSRWLHWAMPCSWGALVHLARSWLGAGCRLQVRPSEAGEHFSRNCTAS